MINTFHPSGTITSKTRKVSGRVVSWTKDETVAAELALLDGCYVLETDVPAAAADTRTMHARYLNLIEVERNFRTMKTGSWNCAPFFCAKPGAPRGTRW